MKKLVFLFSFIIIISLFAFYSDAKVLTVDTVSGRTYIGGIPYTGVLVKLYTHPGGVYVGEGITDIHHGQYIIQITAGTGNYLLNANYNGEYSGTKTFYYSGSGDVLNMHIQLEPY